MNTLFETGFEDGDRYFDNVAVSGYGKWAYSTHCVHGGTQSAKLTIQPMWFAASPGVRLVFFNGAATTEDNPENLPTDAWYSAWYYLPYVETDWLNIMQWKQARQTSETTQTRDPVAFVKLEGKGGKMWLSLQHRIGPDGEYLPGSNPLMERPDVEVPIKEWFNLTTFFRWDKGQGGLIYTTLNEQPMWYVDGIQTEYDKPFISYPREVTFNNYAAAVKPNPYSLYVDDVKVWTE